MTMPGLLRVSILAGATALYGAFAQADALADRLVSALKLPDVVAVLHAEGLRYGASLDDDILGGNGGAFFERQVKQIYDAERMLADLSGQMRDKMSDDALDNTLAFFESDQGQRIIQLEVSARRAISDPAIDEMANEAFAAAEEDDHPRLEDVTAFIEMNDLSGRIVSGAMASNFRFLHGLVDGGSHRMSEAQLH